MLGSETSHAHPETSHAYPETYSAGGYCCSCRGIGTGSSLPPGSVFQYSVPACRWPPMPLVSLSGLSEGLIVWVLSPVGSGAGFQLVDRSGVSHSSPPLVLLQYGSAPSPVQEAPQGWQDVLDRLLPPMRPCRVVSWATFLVNIHHGRGPWSLSERCSTLQLAWHVHPPQGLVLAGSAASPGRWTSLLPSAPAWQCAGTYCGEWWLSEAPLYPIWGVHQGTIWHRADVLPL